MSKLSFKKIKSSKLEESVNEDLKAKIDLNDPALYEHAKFNAQSSEKVAYSNYSYWRCTFQAFFKKKFSVFLLVLMGLVLMFTIIQPLLPNQFDPNAQNTYSKVTTNKWGQTNEKEEYVQNIKPYLNYKINVFLNKIGIVDESKLYYTTLDTDDKGEYMTFYGDEYFEKYGRFILGTNSIGQDIWARMWAGTRTSMFVAFCVAFIEAFVGILVGVIWGYVRKLDFIITELYNILDNIPNTVLLILISYIMRPAVSTLIFAMSLTGWIQMARFIRNQILIIRDRDYNTASRCLGSSTAKILFRNCLPYLISVIMLRMALTVPSVIGSEVFITYIGLGLPSSIPSLGLLITNGRKFLGTSMSYQLFYPVVILSFITISFYVLGNSFSDSADPKNHR